LVVGLTLLLAACGTQQASRAQDTLTYEAVPAHIGQALAVNASKDDLDLTLQTAQNKWVVSTLIHDPLMRPAFWANLIVDGERPSSFWRSVSTAKNGNVVYLTGAATNRTFHGSLFPVEVFKSIQQTCGECRLVKYGDGLYAVRGQEWLDARGNRLSADETEAIRKAFAAIASSVEQGDIPREMAKRWKRLLDESPNGVPWPTASGATNDPVMHIGSQFFKNGVSSQVTTRNDCVNHFAWWCTVRVVEGEISNLRDLDFGNYQQITNDIGWRANPNQNYSNPLAAPSQQGTGVWGDYDYPSPVSRGLITGDQYVRGQYLVGCGAMSVARLLDWNRAAGRFGNSRVIRLPNNNLSPHGATVTVGSAATTSEQEKFMQMVFWPVRVGSKDINGVTRDVYAAWLPEKMGSTHFTGETTTSFSGLLNGANAWLADNNWPERLTGVWSRDIDLPSLSIILPPVLNFVSWSQATWRVNGVLKASIGAPPGSEMPAIVGYQTNNSIPLIVNGVRFGNGHFALAKKFKILEYWDWSENYAYINISNRTDLPYHARTGDVEYWNNSNVVFLSDYYDMSFAAYRLYTPPGSNPGDNPTPPPGDGPRD
jgi:hypothetical protein